MTAVSGEPTGSADRTGNRTDGALTTRRSESLERTGPVVARALHLLDAFTADRRTLSLSELARRSGLPVSTVHRLAAELVTWGALERDPTGYYHIGLRLWEIGSLAPRGQGLRERALPFLEDLSQVTRENVQLAVREGTEVVFVERIAGSAAVPVLTRVGGRFAMTTTGVGLVLLAYAPQEVQNEVLAHPVRRHTPFTLTSTAQVRTALSETRARGYAVSDRQITTNTLSVAAPVRGADGQVATAVSIVMHHGKMSPQALVPLLLSSARAISRLLESGPPPTSRAG
ncbi:IclR family transcriptional regulator [Streptomyces mexicanus]|jgi:DNA-binding IclR family transcriptional regulator|uniref:IclR family transcriptional regulator n=1 Tax=Streptomyces mexicanus TaxID=178566 RepID=UPI0036D06C0E